MTKQRERRTLFCDLAQARVERREDGTAEKISGYAAVFFDPAKPGTEYEMWPGYRERVAAGAFADVLGQDVRGLFNHDANMVLGRTKSATMRLSEDATGLRYEIDIPDTQAGRDTATSIQRGDVTGSSFSFIVGERLMEDFEDGTTVRTITKVKRLYDVGPVTFPAYEGTEASARCDDIEVAQREAEAHSRERGEESKGGDGDTGEAPRTQGAGLDMDLRLVEIKSIMTI